MHNERESIRIVTHPKPIILLIIIIIILLSAIIILIMIMTISFFFAEKCLPCRTGAG